MSAELLQISDLHFGEVYRRRGEPMLDASVRDWWIAHSCFDGFLGHTYAALVQLEALHEELGRPPVIVSGDLSRVGSPAEAQTGSAFLETRNFAGIRVGLGLGPQWIARSIPGNHDNWPGRQPQNPQDLLCMLGRRASGGAYDRIAGSSPFPRLLPAMPIGQVTLRIVALDTDDEVGPNSLNRVVARGDFARQCKAALKLFSPPVRGSPELRGILLHHSPEVAAYSLGITRGSRGALDSFIAATGAQFVMTGHAHTSLVLAHGPPQWSTRFVELRSGTTTSRDVFPAEPHWNIARALGRRLHRNQALLHRFENLPTGRVRLTTVTYRRPRLTLTESGPFEVQRRDNHVLGVAP